MTTKDVFLCHASEDKQAIVRPLATAFEQAGISCWLDEEEILWGDQLTAKINEGLNASKFTIIVLSDAFLHKQWPQAELNAVLNREASTGQMRVLPLLVGDKDTQKKIVDMLPLVGGKRYLQWNGDPTPVVNELLKLLGRNSAGQPASAAPAPQIPMPKIKKVFSDREKSRFIQEGFETIRKYFGQALQQLEQHDPKIETEIIDVNNLKFAASIYLDGELRNQCIIWLGGSFNSNSISYREGRNIDIHNDHSMNDWVHLETDGFQLFFNSGGMGFHKQEERMTPEKAAEYFWRRFTEFLER